MKKKKIKKRTMKPKIKMEQQPYDINSNNVVKDPNQHLINILLKEDDISWKNVILELIKTERLDPWDIDIKALTKSYLNIIRKMKEMNFRISSKVLLGAAILLRIKSYYLLDRELQNLDNILLRQYELEGESDDVAYDIFDLSTNELVGSGIKTEPPEIITRIPKPRERKITIYDLVNALERSINNELKRRKRFRPTRDIKKELNENLEDDKVQLHTLIKKLFSKLIKIFKKKPQINFFDLVPSRAKDDIIITFIPLLHLATLGKIEMLQYEPFGDIMLTLKTTKVNIKKEIETNISPEQYLKLENGMVITDLEDFVIAISSLNSRIYKKHVSDTKNDFADWAENVLKMNDLANKIRKTKSLEELKKVVSQYY